MLERGRGRMGGWVGGRGGQKAPGCSSHGGRGRRERVRAAVPREEGKAEKWTAGGQKILETYEVGPLPPPPSWVLFLRRPLLRRPTVTDN